VHGTRLIGRHLATVACLPRPSPARVRGRQAARSAGRREHGGWGHQPQRTHGRQSVSDRSPQTSHRSSDRRPQKSQHSSHPRGWDAYRMGRWADCAVDVRLSGGDLTRGRQNAKERRISVRTSTCEAQNGDAGRILVRTGDRVRGLSATETNCDRWEPRKEAQRCELRAAPPASCSGTWWHEPSPGSVLSAPTRQRVGCFDDFDTVGRRPWLRA
jgi:hypothetical protein